MWASSSPINWTWGELFTFVDLVRASNNVADDDPVGFDYMDDDPRVIEGITLYIDPEDLRSPGRPTETSVSAADLAKLFGGSFGGSVAPVQKYDDYNPVK